MNKLALRKLVTLIASLAFGSGCIVNGAVARGSRWSGIQPEIRKSFPGR
jgi:hypothetical protein